MKLLLATGSEEINNVVKKLGYPVVSEIYERNLLRIECEKENPTEILISENLKGRNHVLVEELLYLKSHYPQLRIIYLAGNVDLKDKDKVNRLASLVFAGIYDIYTEKKITLAILKDLLDNPKKLKDVEYLTKYLRKESLSNESFVEIDDEIDNYNVNQIGYKNIILMSSVKPGSGKTFITVNVATGLATYGIKKDGTPLKVLVIDADLQNLSIGTILDIESDKFNLKTLSQKISQIIDTEGNLVGSPKSVLEVNDFIRKCCLQSKYTKNLWAIVGSQLTVEEADKINPYVFVYLVELFSKEFDYILIDSNSSFFHKTTYPMLRLAGYIYYIMNLDYNNIRNNQRCKKNFIDLEINEKIKYVLNEDISEKFNELSESLLFNSDYIEKKLDFKFISKIPSIDKAVFLNRIFRATPIIVDDKVYTLNARIELLKIVNDIHPVSMLDTLKKKYDKLIKENSNN